MNAWLQFFFYMVGAGVVIMIVCALLIWTDKSDDSEGNDTYDSYADDYHEEAFSDRCCWSVLGFLIGVVLVIVGGIGIGITYLVLSL